MTIETELPVKDGFVGQRMVVISKNITAAIKQNTLINDLYLTDIGFFPNAVKHSVERKNGSKQFILIYCIKGQGIIKIIDETICMKANSFYIMPPELSHQYYSDHKDPWSIYWVHFTGNHAIKFNDKFKLLFPEGTPIVRLEERRVNLFDNLITIMENSYSASNLEYVNLTLHHLLTSFLFDNFFSEGVKKDLENNTIDAAIHYMKNHLDTSLKINEIAANFNYSPSHFFSTFKKHTGYSPINYFNHLKIQKSCQYLSFTSMSIKEISFALGFNDPLYFSRLFKKIMSNSPVQYRTDCRV